MLVLKFEKGRRPKVSRRYNGSRRKYKNSLDVFILAQRSTVVQQPRRIHVCRRRPFPTSRGHRQGFQAAWLVTASRPRQHHEESGCPYFWPDRFFHPPQVAFDQPMHHVHASSARRMRQEGFVFRGKERDRTRTRRVH